MKHPVTKCGKLKVEYIQIPYIDRYFQCFYEGGLIACFSHSVYEKLGAEVFPRIILDTFRSLSMIERWYKFLEKVEQYNKYLDQ